MMQIEKIKKAQSEARRFLETVYELLESLTQKWDITGSRLSGALRRSSLDLTRALAAMRKP